MVVEFVGPGAVGKSSIAQALARHLTRTGLEAWVEPTPVEGSAWNHVTRVDLLAALRYARTLGLGWRDGMARECIDLAVAQAALRQFRRLNGVVLSQGVSRDLWISGRRHEATDVTRIRAIGHLKLPDAVVLVTSSTLNRKTRSKTRTKPPNSNGHSKKELYRMLLPEKIKTVSMSESMTNLGRALRHHQVPTLDLLNDGSLDEGAAEVFHFLATVRELRLGAATP